MTTFVLSGGKELRRRLAAIDEAPKDLLRDIGLGAIREAKLIHQPRRRTGNLGRTIRIGGLTDSYVEVRAGGQLGVGYAAVHEFGSKPHVIRPRRARVLAWGGARTLGGRLRKGARAEFFAAFVRHPGTKPYPYLIPGFERALRNVGLGAIVDRWNRAA